MGGDERQKDFVGWKSEDELLEVVGIESEGRIFKYKVTCAICSKDLELFPKGYFVATKYTLRNNKKPCPCSNKFTWNLDQYLIRAKRIKQDTIEISNIYKDAPTDAASKAKLTCFCKIHKHTWNPNIANFLNGRANCPRCALDNASQRNRLNLDVAISNCETVCRKNGYDFLGFISGYKNNRSKLRYNCKIHGIQQATYVDFVADKTHCPSCSKTGYDPCRGGSFYVTQWTKDEYSFIKFGITNQQVRLRTQRQKTGTEYIPRSIFIATFEDGNIPLGIENTIKRSGIVMGVVDKTLFKEGFTETISPEDLNTIENIVIEYLTNN